MGIVRDGIHIYDNITVAVKKNYIENKNPISDPDCRDKVMDNLYI